MHKITVKTENLNTGMIQKDDYGFQYENKMMKIDAFMHE
jgi:hypothetical protein